MELPRRYVDLLFRMQSMDKSCIKLGKAYGRFGKLYPDLNPSIRNWKNSSKIEYGPE